MTDALVKGRATSVGLRVLSGALLALALLTFPACSYSTDFVVVNDSGSPVVVRYTFKKSRGAAPPSKKALDKLDDDDVRWRDLRAEEYSYDSAAGAFTLTLGPGEVLLIFRGSGWRGHGDPDDDESFDIESISITGANGAFHYEGKQAQYQFQRHDDRLYKLTYYGWGDKNHDGGR